MMTIAKSLLVCVVLVLIYSLSIWQRPLPPGRAQSLQRDNVEVIDHYLYAGGNLADTVVAGSSLAAQLRRSGHLPGGWYSLGMRGGCAQNGVAIVAASPRKPRVLLLETNLAYRIAGVYEIDKTVHGLNPWVKTYLPVFREQNRPAQWLLSLWPIPSEDPGSAASSGHVPKDEASREETERFITRMFYKEMGNTRENIAALKELKAQLLALADQGVQVYLVRIPGTRSFTCGPEARTIDGWVDQYLMDTRFHRIATPDVTPYRTTDAVHLDAPSCAHYINYLRRQLAVPAN
ncbi:MAG: hypothetical protein KF690_01780 [Bacteroidetes bacterium]|nr:hypothetical protein [Bacteroidota bacterium]